MDPSSPDLARSDPRRGFALPGLCQLCRRWSAERLCTACSARWAASAPRCARCGLRTGVALDACGDCLREPPPFEQCTVVADYGHPWDRLLASFKFHGHAELAPALAAPMVRAWRDAAHVRRPHVVVPVPMSAAGLRQRGFNQAWELARHIGRALDIPARADRLERVADTAHQAELNRTQRLANLRAAFVAPPAATAPLVGQRVLLVDDVMTTGATAREASAALLRGGAAAVDLLVFARTPAPGD